ncbi:MAG: hypothetical protein P5675_26495, partial [Limnospira sp. PMC 917.15]|nr:hypothetical protein [Limnospira sp. PMC 917.15]
MPNLSIRPFGPSPNPYLHAPNAIQSAADDSDNIKYGQLATAASVLYQFDVFFPGQMYNFTIKGTSSYQLQDGELIKVFLCPREIMAMALTQVAVYQWE